MLHTNVWLKSPFYVPFVHLICKHQQEKPNPAGHPERPLDFPRKRSLNLHAPLRRLLAVVIISLYKGKHKPRSELSSYRGVSLTPTLNKVFEKIILRRLKPWLVAHDFPLPYNRLGETRLIVHTYLTSFRSPLNT